MVKVVGVRFKSAGKVYYFDPGDFEIAIGTDLIVETIRGLEYGKAVIGVREVADDQVVLPLKKVLRLATLEDKSQMESNSKKEEEA